MMQTAFNTEVLNALLNNDTQMAKELVLAGKAINVQNASGLCALHIATQKGLIDMVLLLLEHGANPNIKVGLTDDPVGTSTRENVPFLSTVWVQDMLTELKGLADRTALHIATHNGYLQIAALLLQQGAFVDIQDSGGCTPLHWACISGNMDCVHLLINQGASINIQDLAQSTPLHEAVRHKHLSVVKILLDKGANPELLDIGGTTALALAADCSTLYNSILMHSTQMPAHVTQH